MFPDFPSRLSLPPCRCTCPGNSRPCPHIAIPARLPVS
ncbi:SWIM zinc finger family protein [Bradyrhizobium sp. CCBAU 051011]